MKRYLLFAFLLSPLIACSSLESAPGSTNVANEPSERRQASPPDPTATHQSTATPIPTPDPTKQMNEAMEAVRYIADNKDYIRGMGTLCDGRYSLEDANELSIDIAGFEGLLVDRGHREPGKPLEETSFDGWGHDLHQDAQELAKQLENEKANIIQYCMRS